MHAHTVKDNTRIKLYNGKLRCMKIFFSQVGATYPHSEFKGQPSVGRAPCDGHWVMGRGQWAETVKGCVGEESAAVKVWEWEWWCRHWCGWRIHEKLGGAWTEPPVWHQGIRGTDNLTYWETHTCGAWVLTIGIQLFDFLCCLEMQENKNSSYEIALFRVICHGWVAMG